MAVYYAYDQTILGTQTTANGNPIDYNFAPPTGQAWSWSGSQFQHIVYEEDNVATFYNGDTTNETVQATMGVGDTQEQSTDIGGSQAAVVYDYSFTVTDGTNTYTIAVIDIDLNGDDDLNDAGEDGNYLVFVGTPPPPNTNLTITGISDNSNNIKHTDLGGISVCFAAGTLISTKSGQQPIENLSAGDMVQTMDNGYQPIRWVGKSKTRALGKLAPIRFAEGVFGNSRELLVSPQHRLLIKGWRAELYFGAPEVLIAAKHLVNGTTILPVKQTYVDYHHVLFDTHQIIFSEGIASESFHPGKYSVNGLAEETRQELLALFPAILDNPTCYGAAARTSIRAQEAQLFGQSLTS